MKTENGKHTLGPLTYQADGCDGHPAVMRTLEGGDSEPIAVGINGCTEADLRQMAAAPDMLSELRRVVSWLEQMQHAQRVGGSALEFLQHIDMTDARAAIRKATGGEGGGV